ncbi:MAG: CARDB domain-containing protein [Patescibacteria group bacterium]
MDVRTKTLVTVIFAGIVIGVVILQTSGTSLFKGQIFKEPEAVVSEEAASIGLPDLKADLVVVAPEKKDSDLGVNVTISNLGPGQVAGTKPFKYTVYLNNTEVFTNTDSYTSMNAGDSFNFIYPISRAIYKYKDSGKVKVVVDTDDSIDEVSEENNTSEVEYFLK